MPSIRPEPTGKLNKEVMSYTRFIFLPTVDDKGKLHNPL
jgi:hypothetical protein